MERDTYGPLMPAESGHKAEKSSVDEDSVIGPILPSHLRKRKHSESESDANSDEELIGPVLPSHLVKSRKATMTDANCADSDMIGPVLPPHLRNTEDYTSSQTGPLLPSSHHNISNDTDSSNEDEESCIGPALPPGHGGSIGPVLPPGFGNKKDDIEEQQEVGIGPALPPGFKKVSSSSDVEEDYFGPALPPGFNQPSVNCDDNDVIGPLPSEMNRGDTSWSMAAEIEQRARKMKDKLTDKSEDNALKQRESWMTELPTGMKKNLGLTARTFSTRAMPERDKDTSVWTDTPADRERKMREAERKGKSHPEASVSWSKQDNEYAKAIHKHDKSKRSESLLEMHEKKRKKKKKKEKEKPKERQPFDRERDLQVNRFDDAQRKSIIKKSQQLNSRFSHAGSTSSFL